VRPVLHARNPLSLQVIDALGKEVKMRQETIDFLKLLVDTNRFNAVQEIVEVFENKYNELTDTQARAPRTLRTAHCHTPSARSAHRLCSAQ
jgi:ATP synthase delta (OSCP) subunit